MGRRPKPIAGPRGRVWTIKYRDATGRQVMETVGAERDGMTVRAPRRTSGRRARRSGSRARSAPTGSFMLV